MKLSIINGSGTNEPDVMVHAAGCRDIARTQKRQGFFWSGEWVADFESKRDAWLEYNADFLAEGSGAWDLSFYPCTKGLEDGGEYNTETDEG